MMLNPIKLTEAREYKRLTKKQLAMMVGVTAGAIGRYEHGTLNPAISTIERLEQVLSLQPGYLTAAQASPEVCIHFRRQVTVSKADVRAWSIEAGLSRALINEVESRVRLPKMSIPRDDQGVDDGLERARDSARQVRRELYGNSDKPIVSLLRPLEAAGCIIITRDWDAPEMYGFSDTHNDRPLMVLNTRDCSAVRLRFSAAHELGHIVMHKHITQEQLKDPSIHNKLEEQANAFAGELLMPSACLPPQSSMWSLLELLPLKLEWGVSVASIVHGLRSSGLIDDHRYKVLRGDLSRRGWLSAYGEPYDDRMLKEEPRLLSSALRQLFAAKVVTSEELCYQLRLNLSTAGELLGLPELFQPSNDFDLEIIR